MAGGYAWSRRGGARARALRGLLRDTQRALHDVADILNIEPEISASVQELSIESSRRTALVLLGTSSAAVSRLLHCLLARRVLPEDLPRGRRWVRIQYGSSTAVHLSVGNSEFELVEELESNKRPWETLPLKDLIRQEQTDITTVLEVELNNQFLKDGLSVVIPPDIETEPDPATPFHKLKEIYSDFYAKRELVLKNFNPIYLYALDRLGKNIFIENFCDTKMVSSRSEEDFWSNFNLYYMTRSVRDSEISENSECDKCNTSVGRNMSSSVSIEGEPYVFNAENCNDLHQIKELNPNAQIFFVLLSDSVDVGERDGRPCERDGTRVKFDTEATESSEGFTEEELPESDQSLLQDVVLRHKESPIKTAIDRRRQYEEQCAFMNDLLDQWELMSRPPSKHSVKSQWLIADDKEMMRTADQKALASYLNNAIQNANETPSKGGRNKSDETKVVKNRTVLLSRVVKFAADAFQSYLLEYCTRLSEVHVKLLQQFILASFDLARELQVVPKKIQYVATQEQQLYETINEKFSEGDKKQELLQIMQEVLQDMRVEINNMDWSVDDLPCHQDKRFIISNSVFYESSCISPDTGVSIHLSSANQSKRNGQGFERKSSRDDQKLPREDQKESSPEDDDSEAEEAVSYDSFNFDDYEIIHSNDESLSVSECLTSRTDRLNLEETASIHIEGESSLMSVNSSLMRLGSRLVNSNRSETCTNTAQISMKQASLDVQKNVLNKLSRRISMKLVAFVDCLKDTYFGTLQRCLESLESSCRQELGGRPASEAMRQLVSVARSVDLQPTAAFSLIYTLLDSIRRLFSRLLVVGGAAGGACCVLSPVWRRQVATHTIHSLSPQRLARVISQQILERLSTAHERYQSALASLETALASRLHHTEDVKLAIRKKYAPSFARLCLESTSMCDLLMYGSPELGREIGRGQYGVVYSVRGSWAGHAPAAVKSVLPADERHYHELAMEFFYTSRGWYGVVYSVRGRIVFCAAAVKSVLPADERHYHELAMEFFYTRSIPAHPRIVRLYGSVVSHHSAAGPTVLLVCERKCRDLHAAVRAHLPTYTRMSIALDIVEGIRYLHSLGLVHRDIKMKNVLLDQNDRASLTDLGFCALEALMSGSVVGTPVHMAPELFAGEYDANVDVYAFAILFWYLCAGSVKLPSAFEMFQNKEQLWSKVRRGLRPERLPSFSDECWDVMQSCWATEPTKRALLGDIQPTLQRILERTRLEEKCGLSFPKEKNDFETQSDDDSLNMTGLKHGL